MSKKSFPLPKSLWSAWTWAHSDGHSRQQGTSEHHDLVVAHHAWVWAPLVGCVISNRNHTFDIVKATKECVINIPTVELSKKVVDCGNGSGRTVDKFKEFSLIAMPASCVQAPLIDECYANLECKVVDEKMVAKYNFFILEVLKSWTDPLMKHPQTLHHLGEGVFMIAGETIHLPSKMK